MLVHAGLLPGVSLQAQVGEMGCEFVSIIGALFHGSAIVSAHAHTHICARARATKPHVVQTKLRVFARKAPEDPWLPYESSYMNHDTKEVRVGECARMQLCERASARVFCLYGPDPLDRTVSRGLRCGRGGTSGVSSRTWCSDTTRASSCSWALGPLASTPVPHVLRALSICLLYINTPLSVQSTPLIHLIRVILFLARPSATRLRLPQLQRRPPHGTGAWAGAAQPRHAKRSTAGQFTANQQRELGCVCCAQLNLRNPLARVTCEVWP